MHRYSDQSLSLESIFSRWITTSQSLTSPWILCCDKTTPPTQNTNSNCAAFALHNHIFFKTFSSQKWPRTENLALNLLYLYLYRSSSLINNIFNNPFKGLLSSPLQCTGDGHLEFWQGLGIWALSGHLDTTTVSKPSHLLYTTPHLTTPQHNTPNHTTHRNTETPHLATVTLLHVDTDKQYILLFTAMLMINSV